MKQLATNILISIGLLTLVTLAAFYVVADIARAFTWIKWALA